MWRMEVLCSGSSNSSADKYREGKRGCKKLRREFRLVVAGRLLYDLGNSCRQGFSPNQEVSPMRGRAIGSLILPLSVVLCLIGPFASSAANAQDHRTKIGTAGGGGGDEFADKHLPKGAKVVGVKIRSGDWIDSIELLYKTADGKIESLGRHGGDGGGEDTFMLEEGEYIKGITGKSGTYVMSLTIITNKRMSKTYGLGEGDRTYHYVLPSDEVVGFYGRSAEYVDQIGIWAHKQQ
jgi:hypothetical protein